MRIINRTKNIILSENAVLADTPFSRMKGLLGKKSLRDAEALIIKPCDSIHTFFMHFSIDVIFVDSSSRIIRCYHSLKPWQIRGLFFKAAFVIEFPAGLLSARNVQEGDQVEIQP